MATCPFWCKSFTPCKHHLLYCCSPLSITTFAQNNKILACIHLSCAWLLLYCQSASCIVLAAYTFGVEFSTTFQQKSLEVRNVVVQLFFFFFEKSTFIEFMTKNNKILIQTPIIGFTAYTDIAPMSCCTTDYSPKRLSTTLRGRNRPVVPMDSP